MEKTTVEFERDHAIDNLLATLSILNDLNVSGFTHEESQEYGWRLSCLTKDLLVSYIKSFEPEMYLDVWCKGKDAPEVAVKKDTSKRKKK
jgi:hypothetical protein